MVKLDDILNEINDFGRYQKQRYFLICLAGILPPICTYIHSFLAANPDHACTLPEELNAESIEIISEKCHYIVNGTKSKCSSWQFDKKYYRTTLTEEWEMICDYTFLRANVQSIYFFGVLIGSLLLGNLADHFGRRPIMLASFLLIMSSFIGIAFGPQKFFGFKISYIIYAICRFLMALGTRGINETGYVLALEIVGQKRRTYAGLGFEFSFAIGQLILALVAYFIRDWRILAIFFIFPTIPFLGYFFILPESPRWLISKNRQEEAFQILENIAKKNKTYLSKDLWDNFLIESKKSQKEKSENFLFIIKSLIKYPMMLILFLTMFFNWLVNNFVFYGVGLKSNDLGVNPYLSFSIAASVEILAISSSMLFINKLGRKKTYFAFLFLAGISCVSIIFIDDLIFGVVMAMIGKFFISASYAILRLYSSEVFPTSVRNSCIGACSTIARLAVMASPIIIAFGDKHWKSLPFLIFGVAGVLGSLTTFILPETLNKSLPQNLEEANNQINFCNKKTKDILVLDIVNQQNADTNA